MTFPAPLLVAARTLATDGVTAEVVSAWAERGIPSVLLKGPTLADWLYDASQPRPYGDSDLLVPPAQLAAAEKVLEDRGFAPQPVDSLHSVPWFRPSDGATVDLHRALWGPRRRQVDDWKVLTDDFTESATVGGVAMRVLTRPACAVLVALHALQHQDLPHAIPHEDLRRALAVATIDDWRAAEHVADQLEALETFAQGLQTQPAGEGVVAQLEVLAASRLPERERALAMLVARLRSAPDWRRRRAALWQGIGLGREELAEHYPGSRRGPAMLRRMLHLVTNVGRLRRPRRP